MCSSSLYFCQGLTSYESKFPEATAYDLNQNPSTRGKKATAIMFTLTTGSHHIWIRSRSRYMSGIECLLLHSVPVTSQAAEAMRCKPVLVHKQKNTCHCFLAGNSMHGASVGLFCAYALLHSSR